VTTSTYSSEEPEELHQTSGDLCGGALGATIGSSYAAAPMGASLLSNGGYVHAAWGGLFAGASAVRRAEWAAAGF